MYVYTTHILIVHYNPWWKRHCLGTKTLNTYMVLGVDSFISMSTGSIVAYQTVYSAGF